jgi:hypothetical protein
MRNDPYWLPTYALSPAGSNSSELGGAGNEEGLEAMFFVVETL